MRMLNPALRCLDHGLAVIPVWRDKRKNPRLDSYSEYLNRLPNPDEWVKWCRAWPDCNIAAITGYWLNYVALDFDSDVAYEHWRTHDGFGIVGQTWTVKTARGYHVWFATKQEPGKSRMYHKGPHEVLLRAKGGYCIIPPSIHHTGAKYHTVHKVAPLLVDNVEDYLASWSQSQPEPKNSGQKQELPKNGQITIQSLVSTVGRPNNRGAIQAYCPFHDDNSPSAWVNVSEQRFGCNACFAGLWFDVVNVYAMLNDLSNGEAYKVVMGQGVHNA